MSNIKERFLKSLDYFYEKNFHLAGRVSRLGFPTINNNLVPTAGVSWNSNKNKVEFIFNQKFLSSLSNEEEFCFVVAHETIHVLNGHVFTIYNKLKQQKDQNPNADFIKWKAKFNIAADCIVNDTLTKLYGLPRLQYVGSFDFDVVADCSLVEISNSFKLPVEDLLQYNNDVADKDVVLKVGKKVKIPAKILYGKDIVGFDTEDFSVSDIIKFVPDDMVPGNNDGIDHELWQSFFNKDGTPSQEFFKALNDFIEECKEDSSMSIQDMKKLDEISKNSSKFNVRGTGNNTVNKKIQLKNAALHWDKIFFRKVTKNKTEETWSTPSRKLISFYPDLLLPNVQYKEIEDIFVAIDVSGSIDQEGTDLFVSLLKNIPKRFRVNAVTFNTVCTEFDINSDTMNVGGGTSFDIIEKHIEDNFPKYPKAVFILTDGCGNKVEPRHPNRWTWILYGASSDEFCKNMTHYNIDKLLKR